MVVALIAAALAAASVPATPPARLVPDADPAIWVVNDRDTVIFLFGTFHALDGKSDWFNDEVRTAFASSDELVLETIVPEPYRRAGAEPGRRPGPVPRPDDRALGLVPGSTRMAISAGRPGAERRLRRRFDPSPGRRKRWKGVGGLESFDFQLNMFARIPGAGAGARRHRRRFGRQGIMGVLMGEMQTAWNRGDPGIFAAMLDQMRANSPDTYKVMFTERNTNWAGWIANRLQKPGTVFVAVGTGHLVGHDSVQAKLAQLGVRSARIN